MLGQSVEQPQCAVDFSLYVGTRFLYFLKKVATSLNAYHHNGSIQIEIFLESDNQHEYRTTNFFRLPGSDSQFL